MSSELNNLKTVRGLKKTDWLDWQKLWKGYQAFYEVDLSKNEKETFDRLFSNNPDGPFALVFEDKNGKLIGLAQYLFHMTTWSNKKRLYLNDLYTAPEARGQGVGRALIEALYQIGEEKDAGQIYWLTQDFNKDGRRLYDKVATKTPFIKYMK